MVSENGLTLICPRKNLWDWNDQEKWLRSIIVNSEGFVVSCSWKKFGNYGEFKQDTEILNHALESNVVKFSKKEDGSLCIRSVINGKVVMRTRGTMFGGKSDDPEELSFGERFIYVAKDKYPILLDPDFMTDRSLLFEYVSPSNLVVIRYKEEDLIFLGFVRHSDLEIGKWAEIEEIASKCSFNLVRVYDLSKNPIELLEEIKNWKDEGVVARCADDQVFVKIKSAFYLASHRMKFSMNYLTILEFIEKGDLKSENELENHLKGSGFDWEIVESAKEFYQRYIQAVKIKEDSLRTANEIIEKFNIVFSMEMEPRKRKKEFALFLDKNITKNIFLVKPLAFGLYDNKENKVYDFCKKIILTEGNL